MHEVLVVDLDGSLLRSDLLFESFWSALGRNWRTPFGSALALAQGKAAVKRYLADASTLDVASLPYDEEVIAYIRAWRAQNGRTALVTAADDSFAQAIGRHLGLFDDVHGSTGATNLKGPAKAQFLVEKYGDKQFSYIGDAAADFAIWKHARRAVTVNFSTRMRRRAASIAADVEHLGNPRPVYTLYFKALRPHQWLKNLLIFVPMVAAHALEPEKFLLALMAFLSFSLVASSVYVLNDLLDLAADRAHARKRNRPFASGRIPIAAGTWMAPVLLASGAGIALFVGPAFFAVLIGYYILTTAYSLHLKRRIVIDICVLAALYTIRIFAGSVATDVPLSMWLMAFATFLFLSLAAVKRQAELVDNLKQNKLKAAGRGYHVDDLPIISMIAIGAGYVAVLVMALYVNSPDVLELYARPEALWGVCAVLLYWITRTVLLAHRGLMHDDPVVYAAKDNVSRLCSVMAIGFALAGAVL